MVDGVTGERFQVVQLRVDEAQYQETVFVTVQHPSVTELTLAQEVTRTYSHAANDYAHVSENAHCLGTEKRVY